MKKLKLFCFPYAGGSSAVYSKWKRYLDKSIELVPLELAGRGRRISEGFYHNMTDAVEDVYNRIKPLIGECDYALYGHSMGTIIAFELCRKIMDNREREPVHLFVSGRYPPTIRREEKFLSKLPDNEFFDEIYKLGGTSPEILENKEIMDIFVPILKADYRIIEEYKYIDFDKKFDYDITAFTGKLDTEVSASEIKEWGNLTTGQFTLYQYQGDHFFINKKMPEITGIINNTLSKFLD